MRSNALPPNDPVGVDTEASFLRTRWWWVRHAPVREDGGLIYGQTDLSCDCSDEATFRGLADSLPRHAHWVASHLKRTHQTAQAIWNARGDAPPMRQEPGLAEQDLGDWQGMDRAAFFKDREMDPTRHWFSPASERAPQGESFDDLAARVGGVVERLTELWSGGDIIAVSHGGPIKAAIALALGAEPSLGLAFAIDNGSVTRLDHLRGRNKSGWRVAFINQAARTQERERKLA
jgi:alpha-ribazole phosphatase